MGARLDNLKATQFTVSIIKPCNNQVMITFVNISGFKLVNR